LQLTGPIRSGKGTTVRVAGGRRHGLATFAVRRVRWLAWKSARRASALVPAGAGNGTAELAAARQDADRERVKVAPAVLEARDLGVSSGNVRVVAGLSLTPGSNRCLSCDPAGSATAPRAVGSEP